MDDKKIDFIICTNDKQQFRETCLYIYYLNIPEGFEVNIWEITEASSIFSGYNQGMNASDAKYKVYMHHDVRIIDRDFLYIMLEKFQDPQTGMLGVIGSTILDEKPEQWNTGAIVVTGGNYTKCAWSPNSHLDMYVKQIDGLLMATQYDLPWREDIFESGWDLYDCSQCCEFLRAGYKIVVPAQKQPLCLHDHGVIDRSNYQKNYKIYLAHYSDMFV